MKFLIRSLAMIYICGIQLPNVGRVGKIVKRDSTSRCFIEVSALPWGPAQIGQHPDCGVTFFGGVIESQFHAPQPQSLSRVVPDFNRLFIHRACF